MPDRRAFQSNLRQLDTLLQEAEQQADPAARTLLRDLVSRLLELHRLALQRLLEQFRAAGPLGVVEACTREEALSAVLILHGLHPPDLAARVQLALDNVRPYLATHQGNVELLSPP